jgi:hypothetical protein
MDRPLEYQKQDVVKKYITFQLIECKPKTTVWSVINNNSKFELGIISWYSGWRQYVIDFVANTTFNDGCLKDVIEFLEDLNYQQRKAVLNNNLKVKVGIR